LQLIVGKIATSCPAYFFNPRYRLWGNHLFDFSILERASSCVLASSATLMQVAPFYFQTER